MNEETKNIETCLAEDILSEVANVPTDPQFRSLVEESFDPLKQQAAAQEGYDGYEKVVWTHKPYTFTSSVKQMKSNLILLLRRLWRYPFGRGTTASSDAGSSATSDASSSTASDAGSASSSTAPIRSLADMWQHYITRLKGNAEYGIPSRLSSHTDLPDAPALLADRKIGGVPEAADGMSLVHLLNDTSSITELTDDNTGWELNRDISTILKTYFPNVRKLTLGCNNVNQNLFDGVQLSEINIPELEDVLYNRSVDPYRSSCIVLRNNHLIEEFYAPKIKKMGAGISIYGNENLRKIVMPACEEIGGWSYDTPISHCDNLEEVYFTSYTPSKNSALAVVLDGLPSLWKVVAGVVRSLNLWGNAVSALVGSSCPKVIHYEIAGAIVSTNISTWNPTYVLSDSPTGTDLIEEGSTATNNLQQFLQNFKTYIAERLTDNGKGLTITLSQEVRNAIHAAESTYGIENIIITQKGWTISPAPN